MTLFIQQQYWLQTGLRKKLFIAGALHQLLLFAI